MIIVGSPCFVQTYITGKQEVTMIFWSGLPCVVQSSPNKCRGTRFSDSLVSCTVFEQPQQWWINGCVPFYPSTQFEESYWLNLKEFLTTLLKEMKERLCFVDVWVCVSVIHLRAYPLLSGAKTMWAFCLRHVASNIAKLTLSCSPE